VSTSSPATEHKGAETSCSPAFWMMRICRRAQRVASNLGEAVKGHDIELDDLVIVEREEDGKVKLHRPHSPAWEPRAAHSGEA
jgi:hypothetical protein